MSSLDNQKSITIPLLHQVFILAAIFFLTYLLFSKLLPYFSGILGALLLFVLFLSPMRFLEKRGFKKSLAAILLMFLSVIGVLIPVSVLALAIISRISKAARNFEKVFYILQEQIANFETYSGFSLSSQLEKIKVSDIANWVSSNLQAWAGSTFDIFIAIGVLYFLLYFMLSRHENFLATLREYIPVANQNLDVIAKESKSMVIANAIGIPVVAVAQGLVALLGFWVFSIPDAFFWFMMVALGSMIPFVGVALGIVPIVVILLSQGSYWQGTAILIYGMLVVGSTDNILRLFVLKRLSNVHPVVTLLGVLVGIPLFGFLGLVFGPVLISLLLLLIKIYHKEYKLKN